MADEGPARDAGPGAPRRPPGTFEAEVMDVLRAAGAPLTPARCASGWRRASWRTCPTARW